MSSYGAVVPYNEHVSLLANPRPSSKRLNIMATVLVVLFVFTTVQNVTWYTSVDNPAYRDRIRRGWELEQALRKERIEWEDTQRAHRIATEDARRQSRLEQEDVQRACDIAAEEARRKERIEREDTRRARQIAAEDALRKDRLAREDAQRRENWAAEDAARRRRIYYEDTKREQAFKRRTAELDARQTRIDDKEQEMEEDRYRRERAALVWVYLTMHERCLEYGTRQYHAELLNIPLRVDAQRWCMETPIQINGFQHDRPDYCVVEGSGTNRQTLAYWTVRDHEPTCMTGWDRLRDKGCGLPGSRQRFFEAMLWNHQAPWDNWREMCSTTSIRFNDHVFDQPISCDHRGRNGIWGTWVVHDESC